MPFIAWMMGGKLDFSGMFLVLGKIPEGTATTLDALKKALATGERRVSFGDKTVEYRSVAELQAAIRSVEAEIARGTGAAKRQIRITTGKGF